MTQPFADALTWVPKSRALGATLGRAHDLARAQKRSSTSCWRWSRIRMPRRYCFRATSTC